jgi:DMSO/TMAO reductase YedYZ molybdopterin-dependent catalytic subunit
MKRASTDIGLSRRSWLMRLLAGFMTGVFVNRRLAPATAGESEAGSRETGPLIVHVDRPFDAETPVRELTSFLTPNHRFFVRSHFGPPPAAVVSEVNWNLTVGGLVERPQRFSSSDLKRFPPATVTAVLQCSGNGRSYHRPRVPGVQWERGAVGNAQWTGVRLRDVLMQAGVREPAKHVQFQGADRPVLSSVPQFIRSIPLEKALHPETILAYEMNGRPLPLLHGAPLRVITPGWMAESCMKWLTDVTLREEEATGYYMQQAYRIPVEPMEPGLSPDGQATAPVEAMVVKSLITAPSDGDAVRTGLVTVQGVAWSGEAKIVNVQVSIDEGRTWEPARLVGEDHPYAWRQWQFLWKAKAGGTFTILCRASDARGNIQPDTSPWNPSGFLWNGWDHVTITVGA